jgi:photosystem II stability/assembly factor-like uncharacterized protein
MSPPPTSLLRRAALFFASAAALVLLTGAGAGVSTPHSGWYSGNPLLGPNSLLDVACSGQTCYAAGQFGTLLKSSDGGATWAGIVTGLTLDLPRVRLAGGSPDRVLVGGGCAVRRSDDGGETFFRLPFTAADSGCPAQLASLSFPSTSVGYLLLADGRVLSTADGGRSFSRRTTVPGGAATDIACPAERTCFAVNASGLVERTTDGAVSWTEVGRGGAALLGLGIAGPNTLFAVGVNQTVLKSSDAGATWQRKTVRNIPAADFRVIRCADALRCLIATQSGTQVVRTIDGGETFTSVVPSNDQTFAVEFGAGSRAIAAGALGSAEVSNDAGSTWTAVGNRIAGSFLTLAAASDSVAYAGGRQGVLARTGDGGQSWSNVSPPTDSTVIGLAGAGPDRLYVLASDGTLQRSDNGGVSYRLLNPSVRPMSIAALDADRLLLIGPRGVVRSTNGGETFQTVVRGTVLSAADMAPGAVVAYGARAAVFSTDAGARWRRIAVPRRRSIRDLDFATVRVGFVLDTRGALWRTANGGRSWQQLFTLGTSGGYALEFSSPLHGYVAIRSFGGLRGFGLVLRTSDGGRSWHPQLVSRSQLTGLESVGAIDHVLAGETSLFATSIGGDVGSPSRLVISTRQRTLRRPGRITVSGRLSPADGGEEIVVARLSAGRWTAQRAIAAANGGFVTRWRVDRSSLFVAQVLGDADHAGAGTPPLAVSVRGRR